MGDRFSYIKSVWKQMTGGSEVGFDNETFLSEAATGKTTMVICIFLLLIFAVIASRNWTLAYMMLDHGAFPDYIRSNNDLKDTLELYFMTCSLMISAQQMSIVAATLANGGVNPLTHERVFDSSMVSH